MMEINLLRDDAFTREPELRDDMDLLDRSLRRVFFTTFGRGTKYPAILIRLRSVNGKEVRRAIPIRSYIDKLAPKPEPAKYLTDPNSWAIISTPWQPIKPPTA